VYVSPAFHSPALLPPQCQHSRDYIDFTTTLQHTESLCNLVVHMSQALTHFTNIFHCHNCSHNTGNEASCNLRSKWLAKKPDNQYKFPPPRIHDATNAEIMYTSSKAHTEILWYAPQQLWRPIIVCNSLITNNNLCYRTTAQVYHLITWWSANRSIDVVVFVNCARQFCLCWLLPIESQRGG
jgi:hypothetical protein